MGLDAMTIIRVEASERDRYVIIDKSGLEDRRLSFRAKGLLAYLLSRPNDWTISSRQLGDYGPDSRGTVLGALSELQRTGHLRRERRRDFSGRFVWEQVLYERADQLKLPTMDPLSEADHGAISDHGENEAQQQEPSSDHGPISHGWKTGPSTEEGSTEQEKTSSSLPKRRATTIPNDFQPSEHLLTWARDNHPRIDAAFETEKFRDHARATGRKVKDWDAAWRNWIRKAQEFAQARNGHEVYRNPSDQEYLDARI